MSSRWKVRKIKMEGFLWTLLVRTACLAGLLIWTVWRIPRPLPGLAEEAAGRLVASGVENPVTAVLLNFRGYDTLLEVTVLLLGAITIWSITHAPFPPKIPDTSPVQTAAVRILTPLICVVGGYLIFQGAYLTGGAFQGGAVLSAGLVLLLISDFMGTQHSRSLPLRLGLILGPFVFVALAILGIMTENGLTLAAFFAGGRPPADLREEPYRAESKEEGA